MRFARFFLLKKKQHIYTESVFCRRGCGSLVPHTAPWARARAAKLAGAAELNAGMVTLHSHWDELGVAPVESRKIKSGDCTEKSERMF